MEPENIIPPEDKPPTYNQLKIIEPTTANINENINSNNEMNENDITRVDSPLPPAYNSFIRNVW